MLKTYQRMQIDRLASPKQKAVGFGKVSLENINMNESGGQLSSRVDSPRTHFLRKTTTGAGFMMRKSPSFDAAAQQTNQM